jgi:DNA-binding transcriptional regulator YhcF (GntR family)
MHIRIDRGSEVPRYLQLQSELEYFIVTGAVQPGSRLPSIRELAQETKLSTMTVLKAYERLQQKGLVRVEPGAGIFAADGHRGGDPELERDMVDIVRRALARGLTLDVIYRALSLGIAQATAGQARPAVALVGPRRGGLHERAQRLQADLAEVEARVVPVELEALQTDRDGVLHAIGGVSVVATLLFDIAVVRSLLEPAGHPVEPLLGRVREDVRDRVSALPPDTRLIIVASSREFLSGMMVAVEEFRALTREPTCVSVEDMTAVRRALTAADAVVYGSLARADLEDVLPDGIPAIELLYDVDPQSVARLRTLLRAKGPSGNSTSLSWRAMDARAAAD